MKDGCLSCYISWVVLLSHLLRIIFGSCVLMGNKGAWIQFCGILFLLEFLKITLLIFVTWHGFCYSINVGQDHCFYMIFIFIFEYGYVLSCDITKMVKTQWIFSWSIKFLKYGNYWFFFIHISPLKIFIINGKLFGNFNLETLSILIYFWRNFR